MLIFKKVENREELIEACRLRYKVYCQERRFEPEMAYPEKYEMDEYDNYSIHFIAKAGKKTVGTVRLILHNPVGFPIEKHCKLNLSVKSLKKEQTAEISRFAISKDIIKSIGCNRKDVVLGLFRETYHESKKLKINYFCAAMGHGLQKLLKRCGIIFSQAGPIVYYHGFRAPYISEMKNIEQGLFMKSNNLFQFITVPALC